MESIPITETADGLSNRDIAIAIIANTLGIPKDTVTDDTDLGAAWDNIGIIVCMKTGKAVIANKGMKARDIFSQI